MQRILNTLAFFILIILFSCKKSPKANTVEGVTNLMDDGTWRVTEFVEDGEHETHHFSGYRFLFHNDHRLVATNGPNTYEGTWSVVDSNSNDDDSMDDLDFNIFFAAPDKFEDLSDDWDIIEKDSDRIRLRDISGGDGGTDYLTFERN